jgi:hypothetical protein
MYGGLKTTRTLISLIKKLLNKVTKALQIQYDTLNQIQKLRGVSLGKAKCPWLVAPIDPYFYILETLLYDETFELRYLRKEGRILLKQLVIYKQILQTNAAINFDNPSDIIYEYTYEYDYKYTYKYD